MNYNKNIIHLYFYSMEKITTHYYQLRSRSAGLFLLRLAVGAVFISAGWFKLHHMDMIIPAFASMHIAAWLAWTVAIIEFIGGIMVILGWWAKFFSGALFVILVVAMITTKMVAIGTPAGNLHWVLLAALATLFLSGCGRYSLCAWKHHHSGCSACKMGGKCKCEHE